MSLSQATIAERGYLANVSTIPPLLYPFQYNPTRLTDAKQNTWGKKFPVPPQPKSSGVLGSVRAAATGSLGYGTQLARKLSTADLHRFEAEGNRTLSFQIVIDGRDQRPGEPERRRKDGDILADLAILQSFVYPRINELSELLITSLSLDTKQIIEAWFNEPPTALLILGDLTVEGVISSLQINETQFNADLNPVRAEIDITLIEKVDSLSFIASSVKRVVRAFYHSAYEDIGDVLRDFIL